MAGDGSFLAWLGQSGQTLAWDGRTPALAGALALVWLLSLRLIPFGRDWRRVLLSLFGWAWGGFGMLFVLRFWVLSVDAINFGEPGGGILRYAPPLVNGALVLAGLYWVSVCVGYFFARPPRLKALAGIGRAFADPSVQALDAVAVVATSAIVIANLATVPDALVTPLGLVGRLWLCVAAAGWGLSLWRERPRRVLRLRRWLYLLPGVLHFYFQPYREALLAVAIVPVLAAIMAGRRVRMGRVLLFLVVFALISTPAVAIYRAIKWEGRATAVAIAENAPAVWSTAPWTTPWATLLRRFHGLDSLLVYLNLVPDFVPFDQANPLVEIAVGAFVPRALYPDKPKGGFAFARELWYHGAQDPVDAAIAPSMAGSLYGAGGPHWIVIGGLVWGIVLGLFDRWAMRLLPAARLVVVASLCLPVGGGIERDFARATATLLQTALVPIGIALLLPRRSRRPAAVQPGPGRAVAAPGDRRAERP